MLSIGTICPLAGGGQDAGRQASGHRMEDAFALVETWIRPGRSDPAGPSSTTSLAYSTVEDDADL
jgi:hypothetical protein